MLERVYPNCAGIDVHKTFVTVRRVTTKRRGGREMTWREYSTMPDDVEALATWLACRGHSRR